MAAFRTYLALEDIGHVLFALAVAVGARLEGDPLWGLLVAPPSSGKTETLRAFDDVADEHLDEISAAGLLSWLPSRGKGSWDTRFMSKWRYALFGWLMWKLWKRRFRRKLRVPRR